MIRAIWKWATGPAIVRVGLDKPIPRKMVLIRHEIASLQGVYAWWPIGLPLRAWRKLSDGLIWWSIKGTARERAVAKAHRDGWTKGYDAGFRKGVGKARERGES